MVDASIFADCYFMPERWESVLDRLSSLGLIVYEPLLFEVELRAVLNA